MIISASQNLLWHRHASHDIHSHTFAMSHMAKAGKTGQGDSEEAMSAAVAAAARAQKRLQNAEKAQGNGRGNISTKQCQT